MELLNLGLAMGAFQCLLAFWFLVFCALVFSFVFALLVDYSLDALKKLYEIVFLR